MYYSLFIPLLLDIWIVFQFLAIMNSPAMSIFVHIFDNMYACFYEYYLGVEPNIVHVFIFSRYC